MSNVDTVKNHICLLRSQMRDAGFDAYLVTSSDYHASEYVGDYFKATEYLSGCTSDNVTLLVTEDKALLWTDGRYFISAARELEGTDIVLMKMGEPYVPTVEEYLTDFLKENMVLGFDGRCVSATRGGQWRKIAKDAGTSCESYDLISKIWSDRPAFPSHPVRILDAALTGESAEDRLTRVRKVLKENGAGYLVLSKLDDIMWLFNLRGNDIECNPVTYSYAIIAPETADIFLPPDDISDEVRTYLKDIRVKLHDYDEFFDYVQDYHFDGKVMIDRKASSDAVLVLLKEKAQLIFRINPTTEMKAIKNATELSNIRSYYIMDSVAVCHFIYWVKKEVSEGKSVTEVSAAEHLDQLRADIPGFFELSFPTISAYNANAAMAHYAPTKEHCATLKPEGFLLVDSGGQYMGATTDVTRTIALGPLSDDMKRDFTLVAMANLRLLYATFHYGCTGVNLDTLAKAPLWEHAKSFNHGTGHGIGYILNVHEGPQAIRERAQKDGSDPVFEAGMITSDEPGLYLENRYGIRTETITECVKRTENEFGTFMGFKPLTYAPIDLEAIDTSYMEPSDVEKLNDYHERVYKTIAPYLKGDELTWLKKATRKITK